MSSFNGSFIVKVLKSLKFDTQALTSCWLMQRIKLSETPRHVWGVRKTKRWQPDSWLTVIEAPEHLLLIKCIIITGSDKALTLLHCTFQYSHISPWVIWQFSHSGDAWLAAPARSLSSQRYAAQVRVLEINTFYTTCTVLLFISTAAQKNKFWRK